MSINLGIFQIYNPVRSTLKVKVYPVVGYKKITDSNHDKAHPSIHLFSVDVMAGTEVGVVADGALVGTEFQNQFLLRGYVCADLFTRSVCAYFVYLNFQHTKKKKEKKKFIDFFIIFYYCFCPFLIYLSFYFLFF